MFDFLDYGFDEKVRLAKMQAEVENLIMFLYDKKDDFKIEYVHETLMDMCKLEKLLPPAQELKLEDMTARIKKPRERQIT